MSQAPYNECWICNEKFANGDEVRVDSDTQCHHARCELPWELDTRRLT